LHGSILLAVVNCDEESSEFGAWEFFELNDDNHWYILIPPKYGNAYLALTDKIVFSYKQSSHYSPEGRFAYRWDEPKFGINWPIKEPILSPKDAETDYL